MKENTMQKYLTIILCFVHIAVFGQFNTKIGYTGTYSNYDQFNSLLQQYNDTRSNLVDKFPKVRFLHGLDLGMRYHFGGGFIAEGGINFGQSPNVKSTGIDPGDVFFDDKWTMKYSDYHISASTMIGSMSIGSSINYGTITFSTDAANSSRFKDVAMSKQWSTNVFLNFEVASKGISFALRPFVRIPLTSYSVEGIAQELRVASPASNVDKSLGFGLSFLFFNGKSYR